MVLKMIGRFGIFLSIIFLIALPKLALSEFIGPINVIEGNLGDTNSEFTLYHDDMGDSVPGLRCVNSSGNMVIPDCVKKQVKIYSNKGVVLSTIIPKNVKIKYTWPGFVGCDSENSIYTSNWDNKLQKYSSDGKLFWEKEVIVGRIAVQPDDTIIIWGYRPHMKGKEKFVQYSPTGRLLKTYKERPLELGVVKRDRAAGKYKYKSIVKYPDHTYEILSNQPFKKYCRDLMKNLYRIETFAERAENETIISYRVYRYGFCDNKEIVFNMPKSKYEPRPPEADKYPTWTPVPIIEYGEPKISPTGNLYCWARTKTEYKILKWTWQGDPDAPQSLKANSGKESLALTWKKPVEDAATVTGYEIHRSSDVCGPFNKIKKVKKGVLQYTDKEVKEGETYYYQVCAERGSGYSGYSNKAVGSIKK